MTRRRPCAGRSSRTRQGLLRGDYIARGVRKAATCYARLFEASWSHAVYYNCRRSFFNAWSELREARWSEFDLAGKAWGTPMWEIPAQRVDAEGDTKITRTGWESHLVPLSRQAVSILEALKPLTAHTGLVFKS